MSNPANEVFLQTGDARPFPVIMHEMAQRYAPELFNLLYPRKYENIGNYCSPKTVASFLAVSAVETAQVGIDKAPTAMNLLLPALVPMIEKKMPLMFLAPQLVEAIKRTDFQDDINWTTLHLPYEHGIFVLPKGSFVHPTDGDVGFVIYSRVVGDKSYRSPILGLPSVVPDCSAFALIACCPSTGIWFDSNLSARFRPTLKLRNLFYTAGDEEAPKMPMTSKFDYPLEKHDASFLEDLGVLVFGTLMAMNARPSLSIPGKHIRTVTKQDRKSEFWSPNIIGGKYQPRHDSLGGTHASPRMHWRRGHFRDQPFGVGNLERKTIWIEPMLVSAGKV